MTLPSLGGSPAVWNTAMVFFQLTLLLAYGYAHGLTARLRLKRQKIVHLALLGLPVLSLPLSLPIAWTPPNSSDPTLAMLTMMTFCVGPTFFALATTSPLLQKWYALSNCRGAKDPYFLYAASNVGSLMALVGYPLFLEPNLTLLEQRQLFSFGYLLFLTLQIICLWRLFNISHQSEETMVTIKDTNITPTTISWRSKLHWIALAFVPSSLMLSVTSFITSDIASAPLLWVIPLALYLVTFILSFANKKLISIDRSDKVTRILLAPLVLAIATKTSSPMAILVPLHLVAFFTMALLCHQRLAESRPPVEGLTSFYLCLSVGGAMGGVFNALLAPILFNSVAEYSITIVIGTALALRNVKLTPSKKTLLTHPVGVALGIAIVTLTLIKMGKPDGGSHSNFILFGVPIILAFLASRHSLRYALSLGGILLMANTHTGAEGQVIHQARTFFGIHRVSIHPNERFHQLLHGQTLHGLQDRTLEKQTIALGYFHASGPAGQVLANLPAEKRRQIGIIGLGAGTLAALSQPGEKWTFFEIDPEVKRIAENPDYFSYLANARAEVNVVLGDARLTMQDVADHSLDVIILDAYSSDAIPMHLVTREAYALYLSKIKPDGILLLHLSNRNLDLAPVLEDLAVDAGMQGYVQDEIYLTAQETQQGKLESKWMVLSKEEAMIAPFKDSSLWHPISDQIRRRVWTDDYYSIVRLLHF